MKKKKFPLSEATVFKIKEKLSGLLGCFWDGQFLEHAVHL